MINVYKLIVYISLSLIYHLHAQSLQEIQKMKTEYDKFKREGNIQLNSNNASLSNPDMLIPRPNEVQILPYSEEFKEDEKTKHFGYDFFTRRDSITFWENLPTPSNYLLGPGDELIITLWGETQLRQSYIISKEGNIYDEKVGLLNLNGRSISDARNYLNNQFSRLYATLITNPPSSFIDISLGNLQSINVNFVGEVKYPGLYLLHPYSNIVNGLIHAGGIDTTGSLRHIEIKRDDGLIESIDLYDYFINGLSSSSIQLRNQDIIFIPPRKSYIEIDSAVVRPGIYESKEKDNIYDMIRYAGGLKYNASGKIGIKSINNSNKKDITSRVKSFYVNYENTKLIPTSTGDKITPLYSFDEIQQVEIIGQVKSPGVYHYSPEMTLQDLLELASGFSDSTFLKSVYLESAEIIRRDSDSRYDKVIDLNLNEIINQNNSKIKLENFDRVVIHANLNFFEKDNIFISGEVKVPGSYPLTSDTESLQNIINRSGGLTSKALENGITIYRNNKFFDISFSNKSLINNEKINLENNSIDQEENDNRNSKKSVVAWQNKDIILMPQDSIIVKEKTSTVFVTGAVYNPGVLEFRGGKSARYYINSAGGITQTGNKRGIIILYPNGLVKPKKWYNSPNIEDGCTIIVNNKLAQEPFNITQFATNWTSIISSMITAVILAQQLSSG